MKGIWPVECSATVRSTGGLWENKLWKLTCFDLCQGNYIFIDISLFFCLLAGYANKVRWKGATQAKKERFWW